jgi:hypothetical protein
MNVARYLILGAASLTVGCVDAARVNPDCGWTEPGAVALDLSRRADRNHLREDARLVGEVEVRFADARRKTPAEMEPLVGECRAKLVPTVTALHHVSAADLEAARRARNWPVDTALVFLPMSLLAVAGVMMAVRRVCGMFDGDAVKVAAVFTVLLVPAMAALVVGITQAWAFGVDGMLLRNGHLSFRAFYNPATVHGWIAFFSALVLCSAAALWQFRRSPMKSVNASAYRGLSIGSRRS